APLTRNEVEKATRGRYCYRRMPPEKIMSSVGFPSAGTIAMNRFNLPPEIQVTENAAGIHFQLPWRRMSRWQRCWFITALLLVPGPIFGMVVGSIIFALCQPWNAHLWLLVAIWSGIGCFFGGVAVFVILLSFLQQETITLTADRLEVKRY